MNHLDVWIDHTLRASSAPPKEAKERLLARAPSLSHATRLMERGASPNAISASDLMDGHGAWWRRGGAGALREFIRMGRDVNSLAPHPHYASSKSDVGHAICSGNMVAFKTMVQAVDPSAICARKAGDNLNPLEYALHLGCTTILTSYLKHHAPCFQSEASKNTALASFLSSLRSQKLNASQFYPVWMIWKQVGSSEVVKHFRQGLILTPQEHQIFDMLEQDAPPSDAINKKKDAKVKPSTIDPLCAYEAWKLECRPPVPNPEVALSDAFSHALKHAPTKVLSSFLNKYPDVDFNTTMLSGWNNSVLTLPLHMVCKEMTADRVHLLLTKGADASFPDPSGQLPLFYWGQRLMVLYSPHRHPVALPGKEELAVFDRLLKASPIDHQNKMGNTVMMELGGSSDNVVFPMLLEKMLKKSPNLSLRNHQDQSLMDILSKNTVGMQVYTAHLKAQDDKKHITQALGASPLEKQCKRKM